MKCINFDHQFELYAAEWMKKNAEKYKNNMDVIEMMMPDVYMEFLSKPAQWLAERRRNVTLLSLKMLRFWLI